MDHLLGHETLLNKFKSIQIIESIFSVYSRTKLERNNRKKSRKSINISRLNNTRTIEVSREIFKDFEQNEKETYQNLYSAAKAVFRGKWVVLSASIKRNAHMGKKI